MNLKELFKDTIRGGLRMEPLITLIVVTLVILALGAAGVIVIATIRDLAKLAGVSVSTVSRNLNKSGYVNAETPVDQSRD